VVRDSLVIDPPKATLLTGATGMFTASVPGQADQGVVWSLTGGDGTLLGSRVTAPTVPGICTLTARSVASPTLAAQAILTIKTTDFDHDGVVAWDWGDLAILADGLGRTGPGDPLDLNGDGVVDDLDVALFLERFAPGAPATGMGNLSP